MADERIHELQGSILQWAVKRLLEWSKQDRVYWGNLGKADSSSECTLDDYEEFVNMMSDTNSDFLEHLIMDMDKDRGRIGWTINEQLNG